MIEALQPVNCFCGQRLHIAWPGCHGTETCPEHGLVGICYPKEPCVHGRSLQEALKYPSLQSAGAFTTVAQRQVAA